MHALKYMNEVESQHDIRVAHIMPCWGAHHAKSEKHALKYIYEVSFQHDIHVAHIMPCKRVKSERPALKWITN